MQIIARSKDLRISVRKVRLVADSIRGMGLEEALDALSVIDKRGSYGLSKTLKSAVANATNNANLSRNDLKIKVIDVEEGVALKRFHPSTRGRVHPYKKRSTNIRVVLEETAAKNPKKDVVEEKKTATAEIKKEEKK